jgi:uncharacterized membrane protein
MTTQLQLIVCVFDGEAKADQARKTIRAIDRQLDTVKLGNVAILKKDAKGRFSYHETEFLSALTRSEVRGVAAGVMLGVVGGILAPFIGPAASALEAEADAVVTSMPEATQDLGFPDEALQQLAAVLDAGHSALVILVRPSEVRLVAALLEQLGGTLTQQTLPAEVVEKLSKAAESTDDQAAL